METPSGEKVNTMAAFKVADPSVAGVDEAIGRVRALQPGKTEIKVFVLGQDRPPFPWKSRTRKSPSCSADPPALEMAAGDHQHLQVFGRAATSGLKEMFPQPDLKVAPQKGGTVDVIGGEDVQAKAIGEDTIDVSWRDKLKIAVPVKVAANTITDLQITPARKNDQHRPGGHLRGIRHARRQPRDPHSRGRRAVECHRSRRSPAWLPARPCKAPAPDKPRSSPISADKRPRPS